jgi:DNA-binding transcriptional MocR family regulator
MTRGLLTAAAMGRLQPEDPLPSVRQLAVELVVNPNLALHAAKSFGAEVQRFKVIDESSKSMTALATSNLSALNFVPVFAKLSALPGHFQTR